MDVKKFTDILGAGFYAGVPDSQLRALCDFLSDEFGTDGEKHIIAANEGNAVGLAAGYHLATGKVPVVYMQNSGEGNIVNPVASLLNEKVYAIPELFIIGWRGEPGVHDEPQHIFQGEITLSLLDTIGIEHFVVTKDTEASEIENAMEKFREIFKNGKSAAFVIKKGALSYDKKVKYENDYSLCREDVIKTIAKFSGSDPVVSTTGKISRELFETREALKEAHKYDFLTVGSMGHSSSIALGVAIAKPEAKVWCIDGDGAVLMHMGSMAVIGNKNPGNLIHIVLNNEAHETVGGMKTAARGVDLCKIAAACGYKETICAKTVEELEAALQKAKSARELTFIEVKCAIGSRADLGRPTLPAIKNKENFVGFLKEI